MNFLSYNLTLYNIVTGETKCYVWDETIAKKGANEVASVLKHFFENLNLENVEEIIFWTDNCPGKIKIVLFSPFTRGHKKNSI